MHSTVLVSAVAVLAVVAYDDVRWRRIPNALCLVIAALGLVRIVAAGDALAGCYTFLAAAGAFAATFVLFLRGGIGGGDAKLITAMALLIGYQDLLGFVFLMSIFGGVLGLAALGHDKLGPRLARLTLFNAGRSLREPVPAARSESTVPYGLAIAAAGVITLTLTK